MSEPRTDVDSRLIRAAVERVLTARSRVEVDELLERLRPRVYSTALMTRTANGWECTEDARRHTAADATGV